MLLKETVICFTFGNLGKRVLTSLPLYGSNFLHDEENSSRTCSVPLASRPLSAEEMPGRTLPLAGKVQHNSAAPAFGTMWWVLW